METILDNLNKNGIIKDQFEIIVWNEVNSIYLIYKSNFMDIDGFIITTIYLPGDNNSMEEYILLTAVDRFKNPLDKMSKFIKLSDNNSQVKLIDTILTLNF